MRKPLKAPRFGELAKHWDPAVLDGKDIVTSAIGGVVGSPDLSPVGVEIAPIYIGPAKERAYIGKTSSDQARIILAHLKDVFKDAGGDLDRLLSLTVLVRPMTDATEWGPAMQVLREALAGVPHAETVVFSDFLGPDEELIQVKAAGRLR
jgi:enamine deaminase RidA (YjgF/YER057c/UK114 family)